MNAHSGWHSTTSTSCCFQNSPFCETHKARLHYSMTLRSENRNRCHLIKASAAFDMRYSMYLCGLNWYSSVYLFHFCRSLRCHSSSISAAEPKIPAPKWLFLAIKVQSWLSKSLFRSLFGFFLPRIGYLITRSGIAADLIYRFYCLAFSANCQSADPFLEWFTHCNPADEHLSFWNHREVSLSCQFNCVVTVPYFGVRLIQ